MSDLEIRRAPRVRREVRRDPEGGIPPARRFRGVESSLHDDGFSVRGGDRPLFRRVLREGAGLEGLEVGALVLHRPDRARGGGARVFGEERSGDLRGFPVRRSRRGRPPFRGGAGLVGRSASADSRAHLDHHALDDSVEPRDRRSSGPGVRPRHVAVPAFRRRSRSSGNRRQGRRLGIPRRSSAPCADPSSSGCGTTTHCRPRPGEGSTTSRGSSGSWRPTT